MSIKLLANENFPAPAIRKLRAAGIDVTAVAESMPAAADAEVLAFARQQDRWIITFDRDYGELVFKEGLPAPPAILYLRQEPYPVDRPADLVLAMLAEPSLGEGYLVVISERSVRRKRFPEPTGG
jgi:predicted nuclease of predicted toxin-antitoxin system